MGRVGAEVGGTLSKTKVAVDMVVCTFPAESTACVMMLKRCPSALSLVFWRHAKCAFVGLVKSPLVYDQAYGAPWLPLEFAIGSKAGVVTQWAPGTGDQ